jgi:hypothetical protein
MDKRETRYSRVALTVRYESVLFPFDALAFTLSLSKLDFFLPEKLDEAIASLPLGARLEPSGTIARKSDTIVRLNTDRQVLGVYGTSSQQCLQQMDGIESLLKEEFGVDSPAHALFYEFLADLTVAADSSPLQRWASLLAPVPLIQEVSELLGVQMCPFGLRLVPKGSVPNQIDWFDMRIEPQVHSPEEKYYVNVVYRKASREAVCGFARDFDQTLQGLFNLVEGRTQ